VLTNMDPPGVQLHGDRTMLGRARNLDVADDRQHDAGGRILLRPDFCAISVETGVESEMDAVAWLL
jgi:hypothetical protein